MDRFLNDTNFIETAPRPPVPGEENELTSNGGISTKSSGSHKTQSSGKSERSNKSNSPAATPRRSNLDKTGGSLSCSITKLNGEAPLGFEPEGSEECGNTPPFQETVAGTPAYSKWAESLKLLLEDSDGVKLYKQFLDQEQCSNTLEFWFACRGVKLVPPTDSVRVAKLVRMIYKQYIKGDQLKLDPKIKKTIAEKIKKEKYDQSLFDEAQSKIEDVMRNDSYPLFLKSDIYVQFVQNDGESPKSSHSTSGSNSVRQSSGPLPTLHEEKELREEDIQNVSSNIMLPLNPNTLAATSNIRLGPFTPVSYTSKCKRYDGFALPGNPVPKSFPYHVSYAPVSERDSENTSDAHTDDTMSLTDSSIDGRDAPYGSKRWKKNQKVMRNNQVNANRRTGLEQHIPRTQRPAPRDSNLAETDPKAFAALLISKLEKYLADSDIEAYFKNLNLEATTDEEVERERPAPPLPPPPAAYQNNKQTLSALMSMMEKNEEDPQGILDDHFNRIWDSSTGQTPSRSPGRHSPDSSLLSKNHFIGQSFNVSTAHYPSFIAGNKSIHLSDSHHLDSSTSSKSHRKKDKQQESVLSFDGVEDRQSASFNHDDYLHNKQASVQIHHHHHHHHHGSKDTKRSDHEQVSHGKGASISARGNSASSERVSSNVLFDDRMRASKQSSGKRMSESADSGVSGFDQTSINLQKNQLEQSKTKVWAWIQENDKISTANTHTSTDGSDRGSSHKRSHKSGGSSKKASYDPNRSGAAALDHGLSHSLSYPSGVGARSLQPAQPIVQDPQMPLLKPPNPTNQLEEARRRLMEEDKFGGMRMSKSFTASSGGKERRVPPPRPPTKHTNIPPHLPADLSVEHSGSFTARDRPLRRPPAPPPPEPAGPVSTVVGYYFCGDPIPYRTTVNSSQVSLGQFKLHISKKGVYRYYFKKQSNEFDSGVVYEEVVDDSELLPLCEGKIVGKVEKVD